MGVDWLQFSETRNWEIHFGGLRARLSTILDNLVTYYEISEYLSGDKTG